MTLTAIDVQAFAGGLTLGVVQSGFKLIGKREQKGGFGLPNCEANRHLLGYDWDAEACPPEEWSAKPADFVFSNPPCSGFSPLSSKTFRGPSSPINACMWATVKYAARCDPQIVVFESVQQAFSGGLDLMRMLRTHLEELTNDRWNLYHVKHNAAGLGGAAIRRRYFWIASRIPFGVEQYPLKRVPVLHEVIGDLSGLGLTWEAQPYTKLPSWWVEEQQLRRENWIVDGHRVDWCPYTRRGVDLIVDGVTWGPREIVSGVARKYYERHGTLPDSWANTRDRLISTDFNMGYNQLTRWNGNAVARVMTGGALTLVLHPWENRPVTHREVARVLGFPDNWLIRPLRNVGGLRMTWGKGVTVQVGKWIGTWVKNSLEGNPGSETGTPMEDREWLIDHTNTYRAYCAES
jgi:site-specific DNA-cytosine methylase